MTADKVIQAIDEYLKIMEKQKDNPFVPSVVLRVDEYKSIVAELEKKDKEIDILKTNNEIMQGELDRIGIDTLKLEKGMSTDDVIEEIKKKDKIINLMAEQLTTDIHSKEWVIDYYEREVEK